jgi:hypothetical protein
MHSTDVFFENMRGVEGVRVYRDYDHVQVWRDAQIAQMRPNGLFISWEEGAAPALRAIGEAAGVAFTVSDNGVLTGNTGPLQMESGQWYGVEFRPVPAMGPRAPLDEISNMGDIKRFNRQHGGCFFEAGTMRFFRSRLSQSVWRGLVVGKDAVVFITSEQFELHGEVWPRLYTIRMMRADGSIDSLSEFQEFESSAAARRAVGKLGLTQIA